MKRKNLKNRLELKVKDLSILSGKEKLQVKGGAPVTYWSDCCVESDEVSCPSYCKPTGINPCEP